MVAKQKEIEFIKEIRWSEYEQDPMQARWRRVGNKMLVNEDQADKLVKDGYAVYTEPEKKGMKSIKFIKDTEKAKAGEIGEASNKSAESYVSNGYAVYVEEEKPKYRYECVNPECKAVLSVSSYEHLQCSICDGKKFMLLSYPEGTNPPKKLGFESIENESLNKRIELELPGNGKLISDFAKEVADVIADKNFLFYRNDSREIVEIGLIKKKKKIIGHGFRTIKPNRFITLVEKYISPGKIIRQGEWVEHSIWADLGNTLLQSPQLQDALPKIDRIFTIPLPIWHDDELTFPKQGYDERFNSWLVHDAPKINSEMSLEEAKELIRIIFGEFCFETEQDKTNAIAALITPGLRGIFDKFSARTPVAFYQGNRQRTGKDYCAGITGIVYEGFATEEPPISNSEKFSGNDSAELRKKLTAAFLVGRKRLHFSNNKGHIDNAVFESVVTAEKYEDRVLGRNDLVSFENEIDFSLSGNLGVTCTPDFADRCMFINLFLAMEDANSRKFVNPGLHEWIKSNRGEVLSAIYALIRNWIEKGSKDGSVTFASYPEWARVCGGIMKAAELGEPCSPDSKAIGVSGDNETMDMKVLFELCHAEHPGETYPKNWINRAEIIRIIKDEDVFGYLDFNERNDLMRFGKQLQKFIGRILSDIKLEVNNKEARSSRQMFRFSKVGGNNDK